MYSKLLICILLLGVPIMTKAAPARPDCGEEVESRYRFKFHAFKQWIQAEMPELFQKINEMKQKNPDLVQMFLHQLREQREWVKGMRQRDSEGRELFKQFLHSEFECVSLADSYRKSEEQHQKDRYRKDLEVSVRKSFEIKKRMQNKMIERMEERMNRLKEMMKKRDEYKDQIIGKRVEELTGQEEVLNW